MKKISKYKHIVIIVSLLLTGIVVHGQPKTDMEENKPYMVWTYMYAILDSGNINDIWIDTALIISLPKSIKKIVAHYSTFIPEQMIDTLIDERLAKSLGRFSSIKEAQEYLLKDWTCPETFHIGAMNNKVISLYISKNKKTVSFSQYVYGYEIKKYVDNFKIDKNGNIVHLQHSENKEEINNRTQNNKQMSLKQM
ncbi:MAG: hypothetical protein LBG80_16730 [Bacteroidales bacterium]|nr:hypothetical protein [Bacteroidales bacterium]